VLQGIGLKNIHCLRTVFNVAHRLADSLGNSWGLIVEVLYTLDKALPAVGSGAGGKVGAHLDGLKPDAAWSTCAVYSFTDNASREQLWAHVALNRQVVQV